jgi:hypothetical protein
MMNRRSFISISGRAVMGSQIVRAFENYEVSAAVPVVPKATARTCVFVYMLGGPTQLETWDPKDGSWTPGDLDFRNYAGGVSLSHRLFPNLSDFAGDLVQLRSLQAWEAIHERAQYYLQAGASSNPSTRERPSVGSVVAREMRASVRQSDVLPPFVAINGQPLGAGFLSADCAPFFLVAERSQLEALGHPEAIDSFTDRFGFLSELDASIRAAAWDKKMEDLALVRDLAASLTRSDEIAGLFSFDAQDEERYGRSVFGNACIVARNMIRADAGARFIALMHGGWDQHIGQFDLKNPLNLYNVGNEFDAAVGNLIRDLKQTPGTSGSGSAFDETLIVAMGDFGRTPGPLNYRGGRDHYRGAQCALLAGGGIRRANAIGMTDPTGAFIVDPGWAESRAIRIEDVIATIYSALGINWTQSVVSPSGQEFQYVPNSASGAYRPIDEIF